MKKNIALALTLIAAIIAIIKFSTEAKQGAIDGIAMCENIIIPSLLPMLILTGIIIKSNAASAVEFAFGWIFEHIFKLSKAASSAIILGLIGGFPAGAILTLELYEQKLIDSHIARRIMRFNFCGGMAFIITAVGTICYKSTKIGVVLYVINILSSLIICLATAPFKKKHSKLESQSIKRLGFTDAMINSVESAVKSLAIMSAYIILFSALTKIITLPNELVPLMEITNGICAEVEHPNLPLCAAYLSFGGFCIHLQLIGILKEMNIKYIDFLLFRLLSAAISYLLAKLYLFAFPQEESVFSNLAQTTTQLSQVNTGLSIIMIIGCAVIIFDIESKKLKLR